MRWFASVAVNDIVPQKNITSRSNDNGVEFYISVKHINTFIVMLPSEMSLPRRLECVRHLTDFRESQLAKGLIIPPIEYADETPPVPYSAMLNSPELKPDSNPKSGMSIDEFLRFAQHPAPDLDEGPLKTVASFALEAQQSLSHRQLQEVNLRVARLYRQMHGVEPLKGKDVPPQRVYVYDEASRDMILDEIQFVLLRDGL